MGDSSSVDLATLVEHEIPEGRQNLENSYSNLERVAAYCEANYMQSADKHAALDETRRYTVQSLASVAYQINTLASNLLQMLDLQTEKIGDMESQVSNISQIIDIHKEKVARREIGVLTTNKIIVRQHKIVSPAQQEKPQRYVRRPIDYSALDDLGHSVRLNNPVNNRLIARTGSTVSSGSGGSNASVPVSMHNYAAYGGAEQQSQYGTGRYTSLPKGISKEYRTPVTIAPPTLPTGQNSEYSAYRHAGLVQTNQSNLQQSQSQRRVNSINSSAGVYASGNYSAVNVDRASVPPPALAQQQQDGSYAPTYSASVAYFLTNNSATNRTLPQSRFSQSSNYAQFGYGGEGELPSTLSNRVAYNSGMNITNNSGVYSSQAYNNYGQVAGVESLQQQNLGAYRPPANTNSLPPPPVDFDFIDDLNHSPPLPPPPPQMDYQSEGGPVQQGQQNIYGRGMAAARREADLPEGVPFNYVEKVIAIYDYQAEKSDELSFQENAVIYVLKKNEDGWYEGVLDGITGLFPGNYVESCR